MRWTLLGALALLAAAGTVSACGACVLYSLEATMEPCDGCTYAGGSVEVPGEAVLRYGPGGSRGPDTENPAATWDVTLEVLNAHTWLRATVTPAGADVAPEDRAVEGAEAVARVPFVLRVEQVRSPTEADLAQLDAREGSLSVFVKATAASPDEGLLAREHFAVAEARFGADLAPALDGAPTAEAPLPLAASLVALAALALVRRRRRARA